MDAGRTITEASIIIEHLGSYHPGPVSLLPTNVRAAIEVRSMDRFFDNYISTPQQKIVFDSLRPEADARGVADTRAMLDTTYGWLDKVMANRECAAGDSFSLADCGAAPFLFYADWTHRIGVSFPHAIAHRKRLLRARRSHAPSTRRVRIARCSRSARPLAIESA